MAVVCFLKKKNFLVIYRMTPNPTPAFVGDVLTRQVLTVPRWKQSTLDFFHGTPKSPAT